MENTLFKNEFIRDKSCAKEVIGYFVFKRKIAKIIYGILAADLALMLATGTMHADLTSAFILLVCIFLLSVANIASYFSQVKNMSERDKEISGGVYPTVTLEITDTEIISRQGGSVTSTAFDSLKSAFRTKNYTVILTRANLMYIFKNDSFSFGDADSLCDFLRERKIKFI